MYEQGMEVLEQRYTANILITKVIDFCLTVPATWQGGAVDDTKAGTGAAGFGSRDGDTLNVITKPEALGIAVLTEQADQGMTVDISMRRCSTDLS